MYQKKLWQNQSQKRSKETTPSDNNNFKQHFTVYNFLSRAKNYFQKILVLLLFFLIRLQKASPFIFPCLLLLPFKKKETSRKMPFLKYTNRQKEILLRVFFIFYLLQQMSRHKLLFPTKQNYKVSSKVAFACACVMYTKGLYSNPLGNAVSHSTDSY